MPTNIKIYIKNGVKLYGKWYVDTANNARLYHFENTEGFLHFYIEQYDENGEPSLKLLSLKTILVLIRQVKVTSL